MKHPADTIRFLKVRDEAPSDAPGTCQRKLGPYELVGLLGSGGMGEVYRARDRRLGREIAIKVLAVCGC
ncbi:MAG: hypothetical protein IPN59_08420 [Holophaga sp.]|nr:hypothetical protein [Holophaga sp.]